MARLPSLPDDAHISDLFAAFPETRAEMMALTDAIMRAPGALEPATRELIAAYMSGLNRCTFCYGSHRIYAEAFGIEPGLLERLLEDPETSGADGKLLVLLGYLRQLNTLPARVTQADIDAVLAAGWSERALFEAVQVAALYNMMNRLIEGTGVSFDYAGDTEVHPAHRLGGDIASHTYSGTRMGKE